MSPSDTGAADPGAAQAPPPALARAAVAFPALLPPPFVSPRERHLKWPALDWLEAALYLACGACIIGFSLAVLCDVATREIGRPWLWLQQVTTGFFAYGVFVGMALAARRNDHMYLTEFVHTMSDRYRTIIEVFSRLVVFCVALCIVGFGWQNFRLDLGSYRMPSLIPLGYYTVVVPLAGVLIALFQVEQLVNGLRNGFIGHSEPPVEEAIYE
jgi:TRAP-type C4-dicarboxylate transport system permease small subunit